MTLYFYFFNCVVLQVSFQVPSSLLTSCCSQKFVVDHIAKPYIKEGKLESWKTDMAEIAKYPNVFCKM